MKIKNLFGGAAVLLSFASATALANQTQSYTYDTSGNILSEDGPRIDARDITTYTYDLAGNRATATNALNHLIRYNSYDAAGRLLSVTDANNITTEFSYHVRGWILSARIKNPADSNFDSVARYFYDDIGQLIGMIMPNGDQLTYEYDDARRLTSVKNAAGERIEYQLDAAGNRTAEFVKDNAGTIRYSVARAFDELSRVMKLSGNHQQKQVYTYDDNDNASKIVDGRNSVTQQSFDAFNRVAKVIDHHLGETAITYDASNRIKTVTDARGNVTSYNYDSFGNLISQTSPDTGTATFSYDAAGNRTGAIDARNVQVQYIYDVLNRLTSVSYPLAHSENVVYGYDDTANGNLGIGRLTSVTSAGSVLAFSYNALGLISQKRTTVNGVTATTQYNYDVAGNVIRTIYPSGRIVNVGRDIAGRVQAMTTKENALAVEQTLVTAISYLPFGPVSSYTFGNGLSHTASYDSDYRLTGIQVGGMLNRNYIYDPANNITSISNLINSNKTQNFTYDALNRLTSADGVYGFFGYTYDAVGNRTGQMNDNGSMILNDTYFYSPTGNRLTNISKTSDGLASGARSFSYDDAGNRIQGTAEDGKVQDYTYSKANRLESAKVSGILAGTYAYNALGQRVSKTLASGSKEIYHYDEAGQLIAVTDAAGNSVREYIYMGNQLVSFVNID